MGSHQLILDMDTGIDDALALAYLATFSDAELLGVIGTYGNVATDTADTEHGVRTGTAGTSRCSGDARLAGSLMGGRVHSRCRLRAVPWHGRAGRFRTG